MNKMRQMFEQLHEKIDALSLRERAILFVAISFVIYSVVDYFLLMPLELKQQRVLKQIQATQTENSLIKTQALSVINRYKADPNLAERQQLERLNQELDSTNRKIEAAVGGLITPERMAIALESMLQRQKGLKFISLINLPAKPLMDNPQETTEQAAATELESIPRGGIYQHSFKLQFEGSYLDTLAYLRELEGLEWSFRWDEIDLTMVEYPTVHVTVMIHTISLDKGVIGA